MRKVSRFSALVGFFALLLLFGSLAAEAHGIPEAGVDVYRPLPVGSYVILDPRVHRPICREKKDILTILGEVGRLDSKNAHEALFQIVRNTPDGQHAARRDLSSHVRNILANNCGVTPGDKAVTVIITSGSDHGDRLHIYGHTVTVVGMYHPDTRHVQYTWVVGGMVMEEDPPTQVVGVTGKGSGAKLEFPTGFYFFKGIEAVHALLDEAAQSPHYVGRRVVRNLSQYGENTFISPSAAKAVDRVGFVRTDKSITIPWRYIKVVETRWVHDLKVSILSLLATEEEDGFYTWVVDLNTDDLR